MQELIERELATALAQLSERTKELERERTAGWVNVELSRQLAEARQARDSLQAKVAAGEKLEKKVSLAVDQWARNESGIRRALVVESSRYRDVNESMKELYRELTAFQATSKGGEA